ncbi:hypothetical protein CsatB_001318 [Cannabis sativa]|uniref:uncharacterized protein LOC115696823 n=1 Tax=Cannabis sativa TaxID=3483 RepID=UPI0011E00FE5|nr:uncharacterized protein LOC115696823 [Cannabis sativa]
MIHESIKVYVDDIVVKSKNKFDHICNLEKAFQRSRRYKLKMNPLKCTFSVSVGKFLGFFVHKNGISIDKDKTRAILAMKVLKSAKKLKSFLRKVSYLQCFIPALAELIDPLQSLMRKGHKTQQPEAMLCDEETQERWTITFDGSSTAKGGGARIVLTNSKGKNHMQAYKLLFDCTNNEVEYEALILGMTVALSMEVSKVTIRGDSKLVIQQVKGEFAVKEPSLAIYRAMVQELAKNFRECHFEHMPRTQK